MTQYPRSAPHNRENEDSDYLVNSTTYDHPQQPYMSICDETYGLTALDGVRHHVPPVDHSVTRFFEVTICHEAGTMTVMRPMTRLSAEIIRPYGRPLSPVDDPNPATTESSAPYRARRVLKEYAVANHLNTFVTLTYRDEPELATSKHFLTNFLRSISRKGGAAWAAVTERGKQRGRLHHHLLLQGRVEASEVHSRWRHGFADIKHLEDPEDIRRNAMYISKGFFDTADQRPYRHRYQVSRNGTRPQRITRYMTEQEIQQYLDDHGITNIKWWLHNDPSHRYIKTGYFNPY